MLFTIESFIQISIQILSLTAKLMLSILPEWEEDEMEETSETLLTQTASHPLLMEKAEEMVVLEEAEEMVVLEEAKTQVSVSACLKHAKIYLS